MIKKGKRVRASQSLWALHKPSGSDVAVLEFVTVSDTFKQAANVGSSKSQDVVILQSATRYWKYRDVMLFRYLNRSVRRSLLSPLFYTSRKRAIEALNKFNDPDDVERRKNARLKFKELLEEGIQFSTSDLIIEDNKLVPSNERRFLLTVNPDGSKNLEETQIP